MELKEKILTTKLALSLESKQLTLDTNYTQGVYKMKIDNYIRFVKTNMKALVQ